MAAILIAWAGQGAEEPIPAADDLERTWASFFTVRTGAGYKDNVTLSHAAPDASAFLWAGLEAMVLRAPPDDGLECVFMLDGDHRHFLSAEDVDYEQMATGLAEVKKGLGERWRVALAAEYLYINEIMDVSITETNRQPMPVRGHVITARPGVRRSLGRGFWSEIEGPVSRQFFNSPLDDSWEYGAWVRLGRDYGHQSEVALGYQPLYRSYDTSQALTADGLAIPDTLRVFWQQEARLDWKHHWDRDRRWQTRLTLAGRVSEDNGGGYFDYDKLAATGGLRFRSGAWEFGAEAGLSWYHYPVQTVSDTDLRLRERTDFLTTVRCERQITQWLRLVTSWEYEQVVSNDPLDTYSVNMVRGALAWEF